VCRFKCNSPRRMYFILCQEVSFPSATAMNSSYPWIGSWCLDIASFTLSLIVIVTDLVPVHMLNFEMGRSHFPLVVDFKRLWLRQGARTSYISSSMTVSTWPESPLDWQFLSSSLSVDNTWWGVVIVFNRSSRHLSATRLIWMINKTRLYK
jgi:hypothetical protein